MKKILILAILLVSVSAFAECTKVPEGTQITKAIEAKDAATATSLLDAFKNDIKKYRETCDQSKEMLEQTNVEILMYEDNIADLNHDLTKADSGVDCSKVPSSANLEAAFKAKNGAEIKTLYSAYKTASHNYIEHCASDAEYETVFESSTFCDEMYGEWEKTAK